MDHLLGHLFDDRRRHPTRREVVARLVLSLLGIAVATLSVGAPNTYTHLMVQIGGEVATVAVVLLGALNVILFVDTCANELWPAKRQLPKVTPWRTSFWMASGLLHELFAYLVFSANLSRSLGTFLFIFGAGCFLLSFVDAAQEKSDMRCAP